MTTLMDEVLAPNITFAELASEEQIQRTAQALEANGMRTYMADNGDEARRIILDLLPERAEVFTPRFQKRWKPSASRLRLTNQAVSRPSGQNCTSYTNRTAPTKCASWARVPILSSAVSMPLPNKARSWWPPAPAASLVPIPMAQAG